eukprot:PhF_6_TR30628/c0_g1_i1/m.45123
MNHDEQVELWKDKIARARENKLHGNPEVRRQRAEAWRGIVAACMTTERLQHKLLSFKMELRLRALFVPVMLKLQWRVRRKLATKRNAPSMERPTPESLVKRNTWMASWPQDFLVKLLNTKDHLVPQVFFKNDNLVYAQERTKVLFILESGTMTTVRNGHDMIQHVAGAFLGATGAFSDEIQCSSLKCTSDVVRVWCIPHKHVCKLIQETPQSLIMKLLQTSVQYEEPYLPYACKLDLHTLCQSSMLFRAWTDRVLQDVSDSVTVRSAVPQEVILNQREYGKIGIIARGRARMTVHTTKGIESTRILRAGVAFGETHVLPSPFRNIKHITIVAETIVDYYVITSANLSRVLVGNVEIHRSVNKAVDNLMVQLVGGFSTEILHKAKHLSHVPLKNVKTLSKKCVPKLYHNNTVVVDAGSFVSGAFFVAVGSVTKRYNPPRGSGYGYGAAFNPYGTGSGNGGGGPVTEVVVQAGEFVGIEECFLPGEHPAWPFSIVATACLLYFTPRQALLSLIPKGQPQATNPADARGLFEKRAVDYEERQTTLRYSKEQIAECQHRCVERVKAVREKVHLEDSKRMEQARLAEEAAKAAHAAEMKDFQHQMEQERALARHNLVNKGTSMLSQLRKEYYQNETEELLPDLFRLEPGRGRGDYQPANSNDTTPNESATGTNQAQQPLSSGAGLPHLIAEFPYAAALQHPRTNVKKDAEVNDDKKDSDTSSQYVQHYTLPAIHYPEPSQPQAFATQGETDHNKPSIKVTVFSERAKQIRQRLILMENPDIEKSNRKERYKPVFHPTPPPQRNLPPGTTADGAAGEKLKIKDDVVVKLERYQMVIHPPRPPPVVVINKIVTTTNLALVSDVYK